MGSGVRWLVMAYRFLWSALSGFAAGVFLVSADVLPGIPAGCKVRAHGDGDTVWHGD